MSLSVRFMIRCCAIVLLAGLFSGEQSAAENPFSGKKYLIIHTDDAGMSHSVNLATIESMEKGIVSSCSIMVPCPWFPEFADYARNHPEKDYGLHLTMNSEWKHYKWRPVAPLSQVPSLIDKEGYLWPDVPEVALNAKAAEVEIELRAQIERAKQFRIPFTHLDTHMGTLFSRSDIVDVYVRLGIEYQLPILYPRNLDAKTLALLPNMKERGPEFIRLLEHEKFPLLDGLLRFNDGNDHESRKASYLRDMQELQPGLNQIIIHCGIGNDELKAITGTAMKRDSDRRVFTDPEMIAEIRRLGIEVITWKQAWEMLHSVK
jgi:chitin disaccharide deacetylase